MTTTAALTPAQARALTVLHLDFEGRVAAGNAEITAPTARALVSAGLAEMTVSTHREHTTPLWGRSRGSRTTVSCVLSVTPAGTAHAVEVLGLAPRVECAAPTCGALARTEAGYCGLGCERNA